MVLNSVNIMLILVKTKEKQAFFHFARVFNIIQTGVFNGIRASELQNRKHLQKEQVLEELE